MKGLVSTTEMLEVPYGDTYINLTLPTTFGNSDQDEEAIGLIKERYIRDLQVIGQAKSRLFLRETRAGNSVDVEAKGLEQHTYIVSEHPEIDKPDLDVTDRGIQWKPNKDDLPRILSVYLSYLEHKGLHLRSFNGVYLTQDQSVKDYKTALLDAGIPPELLDGREDIWQDLREFQKDLTISHNLNYNLFSLEGKKWRLKVYNTRDARSKAKAKIAAAAHYYLSERLSNDHLIVKSESPEPIEVNGVYMVLQELKDGPNVEMPLSYWLTAVALFHKEAYSILQEVQVLHGFEIQSDIRDIDYFKDLSLKLGRNRFYLDLGRLQETIDFLLMDKDQTLSHGDIKLDNLWGKSLVDLDNLALRPVAIDLGGLFSSYRIPKELWGKHLEDYKALSGIGQMPLERAVIEGVNYSVTKEVFGSSSRRVTPLIERRNAQLLAYRDSILAA